MMLNKLKNLWSEPIEKWESTSDTFDYFTAKAKLSSVAPADLANLVHFLNGYAENAHVIEVNFLSHDSASPFILSSDMSLAQLNEVVNNITTKLEYAEDEDIPSITVKIDKISSVIFDAHNYIHHHVYHLPSFVQYLNELTLVQLNEKLVKFCFIPDVFGCKFYIHEEGIKKLSTNYFHFIECNEKDDLEDQFSIKNHKENFKVRAGLTYFANASQWPWVPEHFTVKSDIGEDYKDLMSILNGLRCVSLMSFIANSVQITESSVIKYTLSGMKDISEELEFDALKLSDIEGLWSLYNWIYQGGKSSDKLGITRNLIPLHTDSLLSVTEEIEVSSMSSFALSQKDDVKSYLEATNKLAEQVQVTSQKASEVAEKVSNSIKTGVLGITTFAISTVLLRIFTKGDGLNSFSELFIFIASPLFITMIVSSLAIFSILFGLALYESVQDQNRFKDIYLESKRIYTKALTEGDISNILEDDSFFNKNDDYITKRRELYVNTWCWMLFWILLALSFMYCKINNL
ncbi:hypothetical protein [Vibrio crassostreae]|uniref:hypothetical protein n=1 Tax=Vibrio crassostreae TaxID=246167 RepID=UPI001044097D|nr:hypothetical protein [Vibrio crassostreae]